MILKNLWIFPVKWFYSKANRSIFVADWKNLSFIEDIIIECYSKTKDLQETGKMIYKEYGFSIQEDYIRQIVEIK